ncbi:RND family efflux transporter, MFP subunit [Paenibacillus sp. UNCCL117]|uniref:efflux RND transporter periplasmic adaptor subunit n=1 Tax=unclassified Paenibacillus TaxID=185978 RepID=UPI00087ED647|nr:MULTISPECIES: efflux RND transporter periplasmic adaptor subunit [unclassified Paenibacillus]SDE14366.1 RND family efflux transporter, MFP subunit [Paenibacillus sp. cl123]SFW60576.1 RND family efflux transporter, MFP subunit [Paenibacillus sp. UNCCL117]
MKRVSGDKKRAAKSRLASVVLASAVLSAVAAGCSVGGAGGSGAAEAQLQVRPVKLETVAKRSIGQPAEQVAEVIAQHVVDVLPKASGEVVEVFKQRGERVEKGDALLRLDSRDAESARSKSELALRSAQESLQKAKDDRANGRQDLADGVTRAETALRNAEEEQAKLRNDYDAGQATEHQLQQAQQQVDNARMTLDSARSKLAASDNSNAIASVETQAESARLSYDDAVRALDHYTVRAPVSGLLTDFNVTAGQTVSPGGKLGQVQQVDPIRIKTELSEANYLLVKNKQELVYYTPGLPESKKTAAIAYLSPVMSAATKTYTLELEVANSDGALQPGQRVTVQLTSEAEEQVLAVPTLSLIREEAGAFLFVQQGDQYVKRAVKLGRINGAYQEVLEGIREGDQLVVTGQHTLKDGQKTGETQNAPAQAAGTNSN